MKSVKKNLKRVLAASALAGLMSLSGVVSSCSVEVEPDILEEQEISSQGIYTETALQACTSSEDAELVRLDTGWEVREEGEPPCRVEMSRSGMIVRHG